MCAIVDNNVRDQVFGEHTQSAAGEYFLQWLTGGRGKLVVGGELLRELDEYGQFKRWLRTALVRNIALAVNDDDVDVETDAIRSQGICRSDDEHVLALARVSGARLLFTNDRDLQEDFRNRQIIAGTRGRIYTTVDYSDVRPTHRDLLNRSDLCDG
jgi:rRNA-processing protein FCF1